MRIPGMAPHHARAILLGQTEEAEVDGAKLHRCGRIFAAKYNKPEALRWFLATGAPTIHGGPVDRRHVVFVDDNAGNVFNTLKLSSN